jgi:carbon-monoxide dehydrogenase small subunit
VAFGAGDRPLRLAAAERMLAGQRLTPGVIAAAGAAAAGECSPADDVHASAGYRRHLVGVLTERAIRDALERPLPEAHRPDAARSPARARRPSRAGAARHEAPSQPARAGSAATFAVNGRTVECAAPARRSLAEFLREDMGLTGTHVGCEHGVCGACTVLVDGRTARSCLLFAAQLHGAGVTTIEGLTPGDATGGDPAPLSALQAAFRDHHGLQCGFCTAGMIATAHELLAENRAPTRGEIREAIGGNLCMCTGYVNIVSAIADAAARPGGATQP